MREFFMPVFSFSTHIAAGQQEEIRQKSRKEKGERLRPSVKTDGREENVVPPTGFEPVMQAPEACALSTWPRGRIRIC